MQQLSTAVTESPMWCGRGAAAARRRGCLALRSITSSKNRCCSVEYSPFNLSN